jgi:hypothetical protein
MLYDLRCATGRPALADLLEMMARAAAHPPRAPRRGPVAILVTDRILYGVFCPYAVFGLAKGTIQAFRALDEPTSGWAADTSRGETDARPSSACRLAKRRIYAGGETRYTHTSIHT